MERKPASESSSSLNRHCRDDLPGQALRCSEEGNEEKRLDQCDECATLNDELDQVVQKLPRPATDHK